MEMEIEDMPDRITDFFNGQRILVTGGTGFAGKALIEKFLRSVPNIGKIYVLIRSKKGKDPKLRLDEMLNNPLFDKVREQRGGMAELEKSVIAINGDTSLLKLGLSDEDRKMLCETVNFVYHAAATVRFDESVKRAVYLNVRGTREVLNLAKEMKQLKLFVYISTAFCQTEEAIVKEMVYPPPANPHHIIKTMEAVDDEILEAMTHKILGNCPNTYVFSKALSEALVGEAMAHIPAIILRPSIIIPSWKEPLQGWVDNINGPMGLSFATGKGVLRSVYCKPDQRTDYIPIDVFVNYAIVISWYVLYSKDPARVYNVLGNEEFKITWNTIVTFGLKNVRDIPVEGGIWYPGLNLTRSKFVHNITVVLFHLIPAYFLDTIIYLAGHDPILLRVHRRITKATQTLNSFLNKDWKFEKENMLKARNILNDKESEKYYVSCRELNMDEYMKQVVIGGKTYFLKEMPETLPAARRHLRMLYWLDVFVRIFFVGLLIYTLTSWSKTLLSTFANSYGGTLAAYRISENVKLRPSPM